MTFVVGRSGYALSSSPVSALLGDQLIMHGLKYLQARIDCTSVLTTLPGVNEHSRVRWCQRSLMGYDVDALRAKLSDHGLVPQRIRRAAADAEERQNSFHAELLGVMAVLLNTSREM